MVVNKMNFDTFWYTGHWKLIAGKLDSGYGG